LLPHALAVGLVGAVLAFAACGGGDRSSDDASAPPARTNVGTVQAPGAAPKDDGLAAMSDEAAPAGGDPIEQAGPTAEYVFDAWYRRDGAHDPRYYEDGIWHGPEGCWTCSTGPAGLGAALWATGRLQDHARQAAVIDTFDTAIKTHQRPNGSYGDEDNSEALNVAFFAPILGNALLLLEDRLPVATRARWRSSLQRAARFLVEHKELDWYVNGNVNLNYALGLYITYRATGDEAIRRLYRRELRFATSPPAGRWGDRGLELARRPKRADGADGRGYLTETGPGGTGYDPEYTYVQLDILSRLYVLSGDREVLRLANLLMNQSLSKVNDKWNLLTTGTRHPEPNRYVPFTTSAVVVLNRLGGNRALAEQLGPQVARTLELYRSTTTFTHPNFYRGADSQLGTLLTALQMRRPADPKIFKRLRR
jgi:hypothetical protein